MQQEGRVIAQAVSRRLPIAAARVRAQVRSCGICGGQSGTGAGFLPVLRISLPILIPPTASHPSSGDGTIVQLVADVPSGLSLTAPQKSNCKRMLRYNLKRHLVDHKKSGSEQFYSIWTVFASEEERKLVDYITTAGH
jgi:hypothetical protein